VRALLDHRTDSEVYVLDDVGEKYEILHVEFDTDRGCFLIQVGLPLEEDDSC